MRDSHDSVLDRTDDDDVVGCPGHLHLLQMKAKKRSDLMDNWSLHSDIGSTIVSVQFSSIGLDSLPPDIFECLSNLEELTVDDNKLTNIPAPKKPHGLQTMNISKNQVTSLDVTQFSGTLTTLVLEENPLGELPSSLFLATKLYELNARNIGLKEVPDDIGK